ncbi:hypothetical protein AB0E08_48820 [Streptomyces sp. NPDC048281]|uniref:hypothetical protein n=1 Tax=Streptomyces sp. NPDC048281 TaxID=3154715 RepID=UPI00341435F1
MTSTHSGSNATAANAADTLLTAHPDLPASSVHVAYVRGLGQAALIQVESRSALRAWAQALNTTAHITGASGYGTTEPRQQAGLSEWLWWRMTFIDTTVDQIPIRLWTLETTDEPHTLATFLAATAHTPTGANAKPPSP